MAANLIVIAALAFGGQVADSGSVTLRPGETVTLRVESGRLVVQSKTPAGPISKYEAYAVWRAENQSFPIGAKTVPPVFLQQGEGPPNPPKPMPGEVQLTFRHVPGPSSGSPSQSALFLANGLELKFGYRAAIRRGDQSSTTDVCEVLPALEGLEHWPYAIDTIEVSDPHTADPGTPLRCE